MFDSSLMQMMEVAYQIRQLCTFVVGSEESPPGEGYPYDDILGPLLANPNMTAQTLAGTIVNTTVDTLGGREQVTQSALRSSSLVDLRNAISSLGDVLSTKNAQFHSEFVAARTAAQRYGSGSSLYESYRDLIDYTQQITQRVADAEITAAAAAVQTALTNALVAERHAGSGLARSNGLSIFVPNQTDWTDLRNRYHETAFGIDSRWDAWLDVFHGVN